MNTFNFDEGEALLINKPLKWTSFDVVNKIRNATKAKKVGHAGTLDPLASGLLIICTGKLTKKIDDYQALEKEYTGTMVLGAATPSYDLETEVSERFPLSGITPERIMETAGQFRGEISQVSPAYSAIKLGGERAYEKARRGEQVIIKSRTIFVHEFEITGIELPEVQFRVACSKGTYIRSLAHDFGRAMDNGAYLSELVRTRIGPHTLADAWELQEFLGAVQEWRAGLTSDPF